MPDMCTLIHNDYSRISDKVMWLGSGAVLNFNVDLFFQRKDIKSGNYIKENFHREYMYKVEDDDPYRVKIIRDFSYYFSIEYNTKHNKARVAIGPEQIYFIIFILKKVMQWFIGEDGINTIFSSKNNKLFIPIHPEPIKIDLAFNGYIEFEPAIGFNKDGYEVIGINVYLNSDGSFFFMEHSILFSLFHMLNTCNMYTLAQNMLNYIGRPEYGTNAYNMNTAEFQTKNSKQSFFNMVGAKSI